MTDLLLAIAHHILFFGLIGMLVSERGLLAASPVQVRRLAGIDAGYGLTALLLILVGACRILYGPRGWAFYESNPWFWVKVGAFFLVGLASVPPTLLFLKWRRALRSDPAFQPPAKDVSAARRYTAVQGLLLGLVLIAAAAMARYPF